MSVQRSRRAGTYLAYNTLLALLSPGVGIYAVFHDLRRIGLASMRDRIGRPALTPVFDRDCIWIHAASVGETVAAVPIVRALLEIRPGVRIVFSNITATGHDTAQRMLPTVDHFYFPFDFPFAVRSALRRIRPNVCVTIETELWPNFIHLGKAASVRMAVVNGRISDRSFRRSARPAVRWIFKWMLGQLDLMAMQTDLDAERAGALGADRSRIEVLGNSKFDQALVNDPSTGEVAREFGFAANEPTLVAGSTHPGEDEAVLDAFQQVRTRIPNARLILAPRRLERVPALKEILTQRGMQASFRSDAVNPGEADRSAAPILILDTIGELRRVYALARVAFVGGTLVPVGGHDLLQPLAKGKPALFGPHTNNLREIAAIVSESGAGIRVHDGAELAAECIRLMNDPVAADAMGQAGLRLIEANRGASRRYAERIAGLLRPEG